MTTKTGNKSKVKIPLETTLGKAPTNVAKEEPYIDLSHLQKPIQTSVFGLKQVLSLFHTATDEVKNYISLECEILFECRICRSLFRSLANFILHKRQYCQERFSNTTNWMKNESNTMEVFQFTEVKDNGTYANLKKEQPKSLSMVVDNLVNRQKNALWTQEVLDENLNNSCKLSTNEENSALVLEKINGCDKAIFQTQQQFTTKFSDLTKADLMKSEVMEIHSIMDNNEGILGPDGKIMTSRRKTENLSKPNLLCTLCNQKFSSKKTLACHIKYKHSKGRLVYTCPECKDTLSNSWCVFRHLYKVHRKTTSEIRKLRDMVHASAIVEDENCSSKKTPEHNKLKNNLPKETEKLHNQQWIEDFESATDLQMCGGCGRRFERRAALHAHSQTCLKRIAVCNAMKEKSRADQEEHEKNLKAKQDSNQDEIESNLKGSDRRKPSFILRRILEPSNQENEKINLESVKEEKDEIVTINDEKDKTENVKTEDVIECKKEIVIEKIENDPIEIASCPNKALENLKKSPKSCNFSTETVKLLNLKIAEVINDIKRKRLSSVEQFGEEVDWKKETIKYEVDHSSSRSSVTNNKQDKLDNSSAKSRSESHDTEDASDRLSMQDPVIRKMVLEVIFGPSDDPEKASPTKKPKLEDDSPTIMGILNNILPSNCTSSQENVPSSESVSARNDRPDGIDKPNISQRPVRTRTTTLHKDFFYDTVHNKTKTFRNDEGGVKKRK